VIEGITCQGKLNTGVDAKSRKINANNEWKLSYSIFLSEMDYYGFKPDIDMFVSRLN
jgi:hypothetical protein